MKEDKLTQKGMILAHLKMFGSIEPLTALREYGCYRLGACIFDLRHDGYDIVTEPMTSYSKITGKPVRYANYRLRNTEHGIVQSQKSI